MNRKISKMNKSQISWLEFSDLKKIPFIFCGLLVKSHQGETLALRPSWKNEFERFLAEYIGGIKQILIPKQVHQNEVVSIRKSEKLDFKKRLQADGLLTNRGDLFLTIQVADCIPIYMVDTKRKVVGLVHAGWRGSLLQIAREGVEEMKRSFNCSPKDLRVLLGPAIGKCCYAVGADVVILFPSRFVNYEPKSKPKLDLMGFVKSQLIESGVRRKNIFTAGECTYCGPRFLCSYRRSKNKKERMLAFIGIK